MSTSGTHKQPEIISFDISHLPEEELHELFRDLPTSSLQQWLTYYADKEEYEVCKVIKLYLDFKY